ncbi:MAG: hypothetical protein ACJ790_02510 [Myxococcaceae bacterium]
MNKIKTALVLVALTGCTFGSTDIQVTGQLDPNANKPVAPAEPDPVQKDPTSARCDVGRSWVGLGGTELTKGRSDLDVGINRGRVKPFDALPDEYKRVLGTTPALLTNMGSTFGQAANRWFVEPQSSAITLYTSYRIAFQGCLSYTANAGEYANAPDANTAATECTNFAEKFWSRTPEQDELDTCVQVAMVDTQTETQARRRWAYTCASVLTAAGFVSY